MSDFMEYAEYYKKAWEKSLKERTTELQEEIKTLRAENARYREALKFYADDSNTNHEYEGAYWIDYCDGYSDPIKRFLNDQGNRAREALKGGE